MADEELTDQELAEMQLRAEQASPAPWQSFLERRDHLSGDSFIRVGGLDDDEPDMYVMRQTDKGLPPASEFDLDFIANARQDVPRLVAEVRRLRQLLDRQG